MTVDGSFGHNLMKQFLPRSSLENTPMIESGKFLAQLLQRVFRRTQKGAGDKRRNPVLISSSQLPSLHCRLRTRALAPLQQVLPALQHEGGREQEEASVGSAALSELSHVQQVCQETCAMSLTRVWMSCRHRGHVSNCKAHSIHIPLRKDEGQKEMDFHFSSLKNAVSPATQIKRATKTQRQLNN